MLSIGEFSRVTQIEEYVKGPGFIFRGNPKNYLTKLMVLLS